MGNRQNNNHYITENCKLTFAYPEQAKIFFSFKALPMLNIWIGFSLHRMTNHDLSLFNAYF